MFVQREIGETYFSCLLISKSPPCIDDRASNQELNGEMNVEPSAQTGISSYLISTCPAAPTLQRVRTRV